MQAMAALEEDADEADAEDIFDPGLFLNEDYAEHAYELGDGAQQTCLCLEGASTDHDLTGQVVWPVSVALARFVSARLDSLKGRRVVEVGAGTALAGLAIDLDVDMNKAGDDVERRAAALVGRLWEDALQGDAARVEALWGKAVAQGMVDTVRALVERRGGGLPALARDLRNDLGRSRLGGSRGGQWTVPGLGTSRPAKTFIAHVARALIADCRRDGSGTGLPSVCVDLDLVFILAFEFAQQLRDIYRVVTLFWKDLHCYH